MTIQQYTKKVSTFAFTKNIHQKLYVILNRECFDFILFKFKDNIKYGAWYHKYSALMFQLN